MQWLLIHGADINRRCTTQKCQTAEEIAFAYGYIDIGKMLAEHGRNVANAVKVWTNDVGNDKSMGFIPMCAMSTVHICRIDDMVSTRVRDDD